MEREVCTNSVGSSPTISTIKINKLLIIKMNKKDSLGYSPLTKKEERCHLEKVIFKRVALYEVVTLCKGIDNNTNNFSA